MNRHIKTIEKVMIPAMIIVGFFMLIFIGIKVLSIDRSVGMISDGFDISDYDQVIINNQ